MDNDKDKVKRNNKSVELYSNRLQRNIDRIKENMSNYEEQQNIYRSELEGTFEGVIPIIMNA